jgi:hypothetical protein
VTEPLQVSVVHTLPSSVHAVAELFTVSVGQDVVVPVHVSWLSHSFAADRHTVPPLPAGCWHEAAAPSHWSTVHTLLSVEHGVPLGCLASVGQLVELPVHASAGSHSPAEARHWAPELPAGCWHATLVPSQVSAVHTLLSSEHGVELAFLPSLGQLAALPGQNSGTSHSPAEARHWDELPRNPSTGQEVDDPLHNSCTSQPPAVARHTAFALPAGCWQVLAVPLHWSTVQGLLSVEQAVPLATFASPGQVATLPGQNSA